MTMKIGLGLYRESLTPDNFRFARQAGATHIVAHLTNYFRGRDPSLSAGNEKEGWGDCSTDELWNYEDFAGLVKTVRDNGLEIAATIRRPKHCAARHGWSTGRRNTTG